MKTFFVLWIWTGIGHSQSMAMDHYPTLEECEAAKAAVVQFYSGNWNQNTIKQDMVCLRATTK